MQALLSFENAPPFSAPLRFFLTAPWFALLAGGLLLVEGGEIFASRWQPATLAATHLLTVGFLLQVMLGALIQILPVVAGANLARPRLIAALVHLGLTTGGLLLAAGFYLARPGLFSLGALLLGVAVGIFLAMAGRALFGVPSTSPTIRGLKLAFASLFAVVTLGLGVALGMAGGWALPYLPLIDLHAGWGLAGWAGGLLVAMAYVVVPMFQLTPGYPARPAWWFPALVVVLLLGWSMAVVWDVPGLIRLCQGGLAVAGIAFAGLTLRLQAQRRRARADATYRYWQLGLGASLGALSMLLSAAIWPALAEQAGWTLFFGIALVAGGLMSFIIGMLYKIIPFLAWLHLQNRGQGRIPAPPMNRILSETAMLRQFKIYLLALGLLLLAVIFPDGLARPAGLALMLASGSLWFNLFSAVRSYRGHVAEIDKKLADR